MLRPRKTRIGEDERRELEFIPAKLELRLHILPKYACSHCHDGVKSPAGPDRPLSGCIAGTGLLSQLLISKFIDHLPLYRFEDIAVRYGLHLPRATLCDWVRKSAELLRPLYDLQKELVLLSPVIWTDDTPVKALGGDGPGSLTTRFWLYHGDEDHPYDVYDFTTSRKRDGPATFLAGFAGYLQADAYSGYDGLYLGSQSAIREVACWAHARRKFYDARSSSPGNAALILEAIRRLYEVEDRARELSVEARQALRAQGVGADPGAAAWGHRSSDGAGVAEIGVGPGVDLRAEPVGGLVPIHRGRPADDRQQRVGASAAGPGHRSKLCRPRDYAESLRRIADCRPANASRRDSA